MSQAGILNFGKFPPGSVVQTIEGNTGGPVGPDITNNIHVVGDGTTITIAGNPGTNTLTASVIVDYAEQFDTDDGGSVFPALGVVNVTGVNNIFTTAVTPNTIGISVSGTIDHCVQVGNIAGGISSVPNGTTGQILTATTGADPSWQDPLFDTLSFDGDVGTANPALNIINFDANTNCGSSVEFSAAADIVSLLVTDSLNNTIVGLNAGNGTLSGASNTGLGEETLNKLTSGATNTTLGRQSGSSLTNGSNNVALGYQSLQSALTGASNIAIGPQSASSYVGAESSNIVIGNAGIASENNTLRIGTSGSSTGQQNRCFIAGVDGVNVGSTATIVTENANQLGTAVITAGAGITVTPGANLITISGSGTLTYTNVNSTPYVVLTTDQYLSVDASGGAITVQLPNAATLGKVYVVKDRTGSAGTNNITVTTVGGAVNIDGATTFVMNTAYQAISIIGNGTTYEIY